MFGVSAFAGLPTRAMGGGLNHPDGHTELLPSKRLHMGARGRPCWYVKSVPCGILDHRSAIEGRRMWCCVTRERKIFLPGDTVDRLGCIRHRKRRRRLDLTSQFQPQRKRV